VERFSALYALLPGEGVSRLWWYTLEFGLIREHGKVKALGAGLLSSGAEFLRSMEVERHVPFEVRSIMETPASPHALHERYFVLDSLEQLRDAIDALSDSIRAEK
jgi:phenylalanine-4-hydroxylase